MSALREEVARLIWETSRTDEGTISATGANIVADALLPLIERREAEVAERAWDEGAWATAERWDIAPARRNPYRADRIGGKE